MAHHHHAVGNLGHHAHVVRDEQHGHADFALQVPDQVDDLGLDGDVQRGRGFIGDQQLRAARQGHGDHHALAHAAGQVARVLRHAAVGFRHLYGHQHGFGLRPGLLARDVLVQQIDFGQLLAHCHHRVQRRHGLLEDHRDLVAAHPPHGLVVVQSQVRARQTDAAGADPPQRRDQPHDGQRRHALAAAGLPDQTQRFACTQLEADLAQYLRHAATRAKLQAEGLDFQSGNFQARSIADQADGQHRQEDGRAGQCHRPPRRQDVGAVAADHQPPAHDVGVAQPQERQARFEQDRRADGQRGRHDQRRQRVGQDHAPDDARVARADHAFGQHVFPPFQAQELAPRQPRGAGPANHADRHRDGRKRWGEQRHQHHRKEQGGQHLEEFGDAHQRLVDPAAVVAGQRADRQADGHRQHRGHHADQQGGAAAIDHAGQHVAHGQGRFAGGDRGA
ncbi:hypothetical protein G6F35_009204 [Rhizopus arrhizus]|nr:hypothetical protein G6F35_009204 [Rhizopus arrhizus]